MTRQPLIRYRLHCPAIACVVLVAHMVATETVREDDERGRRYILWYFQFAVDISEGSGDGYDHQLCLRGIVSLSKSSFFTSLYHENGTFINRKIQENPRCGG